MNLFLVVVLFALVAGGSCGKSPGGPFKPSKPSGPPLKALCNKAFTLSPDEAEPWRNATVTCVAAQPGLEAIIIGIDPNFGGSNATVGSSDSLISSNSIANVASVLEANGYSDNATALRGCIATEMGLRWSL